MPGPIEDYGMLGDLRTAALVGRDGSIDWLCLPRFDAPACFAALLHDDRAGQWQIAPAAGGPATRRRYRDDTLILESEWDTPLGTVRLVDCMPPRGEAAAVVRVVEGVSGRVPMRMRLRLRFDYGRLVPGVRHRDEELAAVAGPDAVRLRTPVGLTGDADATTAEFTVDAGARVPFVLTYQRSYAAPAAPVDAATAIDRTGTFWAAWIGRCGYHGKWPHAVRRALILLKALTYAPTGGILAAATTSLPEEFGGLRNWDHRFCWLRDATFTVQALLGTGYVGEARAFRAWLLRAVAGDPADLQIRYALDGTRRVPGYPLDWLSGYQGARPVRVGGNPAAGRFPLGGWGEVLDALHLCRAAGLAGPADDWDRQRALLEFLEGTWDQPDNGRWEIGDPRRPFVHSKVMAWAGFDRAVQAVERFGLDGPLRRWRGLRDRIHAEVCAYGFDPDRNTFTQFYGSQGLDAALLLMPRVGFLGWDDPRMAGTVAAIQRDLCEDGLVLRYRNQEDGNIDGLPGQEGAYLPGTFWLVDALHGMGRTGEAVDLFERVLGLRTDLGLLAEEYDPARRCHLGNTPQAASLVGLVNSARHLSGTPTRTTVPAEEQELAC